MLNFDVRSVRDGTSSQAVATAAVRLGLAAEAGKGAFRRKPCPKEGFCNSLIAMDAEASSSMSSSSSSSQPFLSLLLKPAAASSSSSSSSADLRAALYAGRLVVLLFSVAPAQLDALRAAVCADILLASSSSSSSSAFPHARALSLHPLPDLGVVALYTTVPGRPVVRPPSRMPPALYSGYTLGGRVPVLLRHMSEVSTSESASPAVIYTRAEIESAFARARRREVYYYGALDTYLYEALESHPVRGKKVFVMGSTIPWYEVIALEFGASAVTVVEYGARISEDPRLVFRTPFELDDLLAGGERADVAFSLSSFEHDGLGRYGDPLGPDADLRTMRRMRDEVLRPGGLLFLSVPVGPDVVFWNAHRVYGRARLPRLIEGWEVVATVGLRNPDDFDERKSELGFSDQPVLVLRAPGK
jgi:hypothetical protein